jgi:hypothetical protein
MASYFLLMIWKNSKLTPGSVISIDEYLWEISGGVASEWTQHFQMAKTTSTKKYCNLASGKWNI